jgi:hypothetical protein
MPRGPAPKPADQRRRRNEPERGEWQALEAIGWQHGPIPALPDGLRDATVEAWTIWMGSWIAAHWIPEDLPGLRQLIRLYDQVERGEFQRANELRIEMDTFGLTPKGRQDRRWAPPASESPAAQVRQVRGRKLKAV